MDEQEGGCGGGGGSDRCPNTDYIEMKVLLLIFYFNLKAGKSSETGRGGGDKGRGFG